MRRHEPQAGSGNSSRSVVPAAIMVLGLGLVGVHASPPLETFQLPLYSFDRQSNGNTNGVNPDDVLVYGPDAATVAYSGIGLGLGQTSDDLDALSVANPSVPLMQSFVLLFSVDRPTVGLVPPDPQSIHQQVPFNVTDQAGRGHAAGDMYMSLLPFSRAGRIGGALRDPVANNSLAVNNFDEGGRDFQAAPEVSAATEVPAATEDDVDATAMASTNGSGAPQGGMRGDGRPVPPHLYFSLRSGSTSLGSQYSPADIFFDPDPTLGDTESVYAYAEQLALQPMGDDLDGLLLFDVNTNGLFDGQDQVLFTLARGSVTLQMIGASPADVFSVFYGQMPTLYASGVELGLGYMDHVDALDLLYCADPIDCARRFCIRLVHGDFDNDGDVDIVDMPDFVWCISGPREGVGFTPPPQPCREFGDFDYDFDVDLADFAMVQAVFANGGPP